MSAYARNQSSSDGDPYEDALQRALADLAQVRVSVAQARSQLSSAVEQEARLIELVRQLLNMLPEQRRAIFSGRLDESSADDGGAGRGGETFENVIRLFRQMPHRRDWTVSTVKEELEKRDFPSDAKSVHNVLYYLHRRGDLQRVGRGMYRVRSSGVGVYSDDPLLDQMTGYSNKSET